MFTIAFKVSDLLFQDGFTVLMLAAQNGNDEFVTELSKFNANIDQKHRSTHHIKHIKHTPADESSFSGVKELFANGGWKSAESTTARTIIPRISAANHIPFSPTIIDLYVNTSNTECSERKKNLSVFLWFRFECFSLILWAQRAEERFDRFLWFRERSEQKKNSNVFFWFIECFLGFRERSEKLEGKFLLVIWKFWFV